MKSTSGNVIVGRDWGGNSFVLTALMFFFRVMRCCFLAEFVQPPPVKPPTMVLITLGLHLGDFRVAFVHLLL